jgi:hypothetical protein
MKFKIAPKSPVFPQSTRWSIEKRKGGYESDITAMMRDMLKDETIREDQRFAWDRWRNDERLAEKGKD